MPDKITTFKELIESKQFKRRTNNKEFNTDDLIEIEKLYEYIMSNDFLISNVGNYNTFISLINFEICDLVNRYKFLKENRYKNTEETFICRYGKEEGIKRWNSYKNKHSIKNKFEYKSKNFGWSKEKFDEFNKSRSVTLENCIKRHGEVKGKEIWENYVDRQRYTNSLEYYEEKYGDQGYNEWLKYNEEKGKSRRLSWIMEKYNVDESNGLLILSEKSNNSYSSLAELSFIEILENQLNDTIKYSAKTSQYSLWCKYTDSICFYDITCTSRKKIIEFNGDYWHCNPNLYESNFYHKHLQKTAKEIWEKDFLKIKTANECGFDVKIVWYSDFEKDPNIIIKECVEWMKS